ncbi:MAG: hypothetical protein R3F17_13785 [Planctomycetota bacterium]
MARTQRNGIDLQTKANENLYRLHQRTGIPLVATNDIHYLRAEDCHTQDILLCINTGAKREDEKRFRFETDTLYFKTREEMAHMFRDLPDAVRATMDVAERVDLSTSSAVPCRSSSATPARRPTCCSTGC